jgi:hypothetical protein
MTSKTVTFADHTHTGLCWEATTNVPTHLRSWEGQLQVHEAVAVARQFADADWTIVVATECPGHTELSAIAATPYRYTVRTLNAWICGANDIVSRHRTAGAAQRAAAGWELVVIDNQTGQELPSDAREGAEVREAAGRQRQGVIDRAHARTQRTRLDLAAAEWEDLASEARQLDGVARVDTDRIVYGVNAGGGDEAWIERGDYQHTICEAGQRVNMPYGMRVSEVLAAYAPDDASGKE